MDRSLLGSAVTAATSAASALGLKADDTVVVHDSNRIAVHLLPCNTLARVGPMAFHGRAQFEVEVARRLAHTATPVATLEPRVEARVYEVNGFAITFWTYYEEHMSGDVPPPEYAQALRRMHGGMQALNLPVPHFTDRVAQAKALVANPDQTPNLVKADRELLGDTLAKLTRAISEWHAPEQLLHGEPHPGNLLRTSGGLLFVDLETCCRGPVEFDVAHTPAQVGVEYPRLNQGLLRDCRILVLAMIATWRWDRDDQLPNGRHWGTEWLNQLREAVGS